MKRASNKRRSWPTGSARWQPPAAIYVSPLQRARQTIAPFEEATGTTATVVDDLAEWYGGGWEFKEFEELLHEHPEMPSRVLRQDPIFFLAPGGEPQDAFQGTGGRRRGSRTRRASAMAMSGSSATAA